MEIKYRKIICPNGHESVPVKESEALPRRCSICRQLYLKSAKPIWCDLNGNTLTGEMISTVSAHRESSEIILSEEPTQIRQKRKSFNLREDEENSSSTKIRRRNSFDGTIGGMFAQSETVSDSLTKAFAEQHQSSSQASYILRNGEYSIRLTGEGILGRESIGKEILSVNRLVSRIHCFYIATFQNGLQIRDAGSLNGTYADIGDGRFSVGEKKRSNSEIWRSALVGRHGV